MEETFHSMPHFHELLPKKRDKNFNRIGEVEAIFSSPSPSSSPSTTTTVTHPLLGEAEPKTDTWTDSRTLGRGGFGTVIVQECVAGRSKGSLRAVKRVLKGSVEGVGKLEKEFTLLHELTNLNENFQRRQQNIVRTFGWYQSPTELFLTMEYLPYGDLGQYLTRPFKEGECKSILRQILSGLYELHKLSYTHRDIKPANILIASPSPHWHIKLADFGIASLHISADHDLLSTAAVIRHQYPTHETDNAYLIARAKEYWGISETDAELDSTHIGGEDLGKLGLKTFIGTPEYMAPEIFRTRWGGAAYDKAVDIWAVGAIAYVMLTGRRLPQDYISSCRYTLTQPVLKFPPGTPVGRGARLFLTQLLASKPEERPDIFDCQHIFWLRNHGSYPPYVLKPPPLPSVSSNFPKTLDLSNSFITPRPHTDIDFSPGTAGEKEASIGPKITRSFAAYDLQLGSVSQTRYLELCCRPQYAMLDDDGEEEEPWMWKGKLKTKVKMRELLPMIRTRNPGEAMRWIIADEPTIIKHEHTLELELEPELATENKRGKAADSDAGLMALLCPGSNPNPNPSQLPQNDDFGYRMPISSAKHHGSPNDSDSGIESDYEPTITVYKPWTE